MPMGGDADAWFDRELAGCRVRHRCFWPLRFLPTSVLTSGPLRVAQIGSAMGQSIPLVCQDWANTKAAYRFLSNEADILAGTFNRRVIALSPPTVVFLCSMIRPSAS